MTKLLILTVCAFLICPVSSQAQNGAYVRKTVKPNFFIPKSAEPQPEKLPMPYYRGNEKTASKTTRNFPDTGTDAVETQQQIQTPPTISVPLQTQEKPSETPAAEAVMQNLSDTPEYQQKYQEYLRDLEYIAATGERPANPGLDNDLKQMNSNERIKVDKNFNSRRNIKAEFEKILNQSLQK